MNLSNKCQYAVRAILELSKQYGRAAIPASEVAVAQVVPQRFLELILNELKTSGLVDSKRGAQGGFFLTTSPNQITVGQIIRIMEGPLDPVRCSLDQGEGAECCALRDTCVLINLWNRARMAAEEVYDSVTFADLVREEEELVKKDVLNYNI